MKRPANAGRFHIVYRVRRAGRSVSFSLTSAASVPRLRELRARPRARTFFESMVRVSRVHPDSIAAELGIESGTELRSVNGREIADFLDWEFLTADDELIIEARLP